MLAGVMEFPQQLFFSSEAAFMGTITNDHMDPTHRFNPIVESFNQGFDDCMFFDATLLDNPFDSSIDLPLDAVACSPGFDLSFNGEAPSCDAKENHDQNCSEGNYPSSETASKPKRDQSRTLLSERKRRSKMKERLYQLRSLVPNITKMDKASIIGDAVIYVKSLQDRAKKLVGEVSVLELSSKDEQVFRVPRDNEEAKQAQECKNNQWGGKILNVVTQEVGEGRFYVEVECNKGDEVVSAFYNSFESIECFHMESSNLSFTSDLFRLTLTLNTRGAGVVMTAASMKLWVIGALLKEGFRFEMP